MQINDYDPIADLYDTYVPLTHDIDFFVNETHKSSGEVLELMSGSGRISIPLIKSGVKLTCVDKSAGMNAVLKNKLTQLGLNADIVQMDVCELELHKQFGMVIIPLNSFSHITTPINQFMALDRIHRHLVPGGTFICTLGNPYVRQQNINGHLRLLRQFLLPETNGKLLLWTLEQCESVDPQVVDSLQFYEEYDARGVLISKRVLELRFRLSYIDEFEKLATLVGFKLKAFYGDYIYSDFNRDSPDMIWVLENPG